MASGEGNERSDLYTPPPKKSGAFMWADAIEEYLESDSSAPFPPRLRKKLDENFEGAKNHIAAALIQLGEPDGTLQIILEDYHGVRHFKKVDNMSMQGIHTGQPTVPLLIKQAEAVAELPKDWKISKRHKSTNSHKKMPRSYRKRSGSRKSNTIAVDKDGNFVDGIKFYYDKVEKKRIERPNSIRRRKDIVWTPADYATSKFGFSSALASDAQKLNRAMHGYTGQGKYNGPGLGRIMNRARGYIGGAAKLAGAGIAAYKGLKGGLYGGQGAYTHRNSLMEDGNPSMTIHAQSDETDDITLSNEEWIRPIYAPYIAPGTSSTFSSQLIDVNPGLFNFCPKLAAIAANYTHYELHQLVFQYRTKVNESNVNNGIAGDVLMTVTYDPSNDSFDSVQDIMQTSGRAMGRIVESLEIGVECDAGKSKDTRYFVRTTPVPIGRDIDEFDHCGLLVASNNVPHTYSNTAIGDLWCYYTVTLKQWKPGASKLNNQQRDLFVENTSRSELSTFYNAAAVLTNGLNPTVVKAQQSNIGGMISAIAAASKTLRYTFPAEMEGYFELTLSLEGTSLTSTSIALGQTGNVVAIADIYASLGSANSPAPTSNTTLITATGQFVTFHVKVRAATSNVDNQVQFTLQGGAATGTVTSWSLDVKEMTQNTWQSRQIPTPKFINLQTGIEVSI